ncbi:MAG: hypothetical protein ACXACY_13310 [Candidatus Hodarchaeales archaeon]|jgi:hypothetical protein
MRPKVKMNPFAVWAMVFNMTEGRFFTVEFFKKNGELRRLNGRIFQYIDPTSANRHIIVRDIQAHKRGEEGYRKIDPGRINAFKCGNFQIGTFELRECRFFPKGE